MKGTNEKSAKLGHRGSGRGHLIYSVSRERLKVETWN